MNKDDSKPAAQAPQLSSAELGFLCAKWGIQLLIDSGWFLSARNGGQMETGRVLFSAQDTAAESQ